MGESHIYTSADDLRWHVRRDRLPLGAQGTPPVFARLVYCLGYGETALLDGLPHQRNSGTRQFWDLFGRLAGTGRSPRRREHPILEARLQWKIRTLEILRNLGVWVTDASLHAMYAPGGKRVGSRLCQALHQSWWEGYGAQQLSNLGPQKVWIIGKTVADVCDRLAIPYDGWIYQPGAGRSPTRDLTRGWKELLEDVSAF
ncbi:hypothetical protein [Rubidibacter lacunae]|uniref:hypothetical protein n=1 Tax=Rubidibacter lacunae TaxID=582514 RepID=UPI0012EB37E5|nr:hypothetical protein [Rubidibacter lacunae]